MGVLSKSSQPVVGIDNLDGVHDHLYVEVLSSTGMLSDTDAVPTIESFPNENGYHDHVRECIRIYERLLNSSARVRLPRRISEGQYQSAVSPAD
ncbi:MAG: hypothetical protein ACWGN2_10515 [Anaerolineales bacterium]